MSRGRSRLLASGVWLLGAVCLLGMRCNAATYTEKVYLNATVLEGRFRCGQLDEVMIDVNGDGHADRRVLLRGAGVLEEMETWRPLESWADTNGDGKWDTLMIRRDLGLVGGAMIFVDEDKDGTFDRVAYGDNAIELYSNLMFD